MPAAPSKPYLVDLALDRGAEADLSKDPFNLPAVASLDVLRFHPEGRDLVSENGLGKSPDAVTYGLLQSPRRVREEGLR